MKTLHTKSPCCRGKVHRFGNRRRQCRLCGRTWRIRRKKKGRRHHRINKDFLVKTFFERRTLVQQMRSNYPSLATLRQRFRKALVWIDKQPREYTFNCNQLILIADGLWFRFKRQDWVLYLMAIKPVDDNQATLIDPILLPGKEGYENWDYAIRTIPEEVKIRIKAFVSDNFRSSKGLVKQHHWIHQLCHFHLIAQLQIRRGRRKSTLGAKDTREEIYLKIREALETTDEQRLELLQGDLEELASRSDCPRKLRMITREFLREINSFRAYLLYPKLNLPNTTNTIEVTGKLVRQVSRTISSPKALHLWATAFIRLHPAIACNGKKINQIKLS